MQNITHQIRNITKRISLYLAWENEDASFIKHSGIPVEGQEAIQLQVVEKVSSDLSLSRATKEKIFFASESPELTSEELTNAVAVFKLLKQWEKELEQRSFGNAPKTNATISEPESSADLWTRGESTGKRSDL